MSVSSRQASRRTPSFPIRFALFFAAFYVYVWMRIDPRLIYFWPYPGFPAFSADLAFFMGFLAYPGGLAEYVSAFLSQSHYYSWLGALVITIVGGLLCLTAGVFVTSIGGSRPRVIHFIPPLLLLVLYNRYVCALEMTIGLLTAMAFVCLYVRMPLRIVPVRAAAFVVLSVLLYYLAGGAFLLFAALCGIFELLTARRRLLGLLCLVSGAVIPYLVGTFVYGLRITDTYGRLLPYHLDTDPRSRPLAVCLYLFLPVAAVAVTVWRRRRRDRSAARGETTSGLVSKFARRLRRSKSTRVLRSLALLVMAAVVVWFSFDSRMNAWLRIEYCARHGMWQRLLQQARRLSGEQYSSLVSYSTNQALYHEGMLPDDMFSFLQHPLGLLPSGKRIREEIFVSGRALMKLSDIFFELGRVNESEHMAQEAFEHVGSRPWVLQRIALTRTIKGQTEGARLLLRALSKDLVYRRWARTYLRRLDADPQFSQDQQVQRMRSIMPVEDYAGHLTAEVMMLQLLDRNKRNRMAFEYLMAHYLLARDLEGLARNIGRLDDFDYVGVPRHYEEALLIYTTITGQEVYLRGRTISERTLERFEHFSRIVERHRDDPREAKRTLARHHRDTYFFYYLFAPVEETE